MCAPVPLNQECGGTGSGTGEVLVENPGEDHTIKALCDAEIDQIINSANSINSGAHSISAETCTKPNWIGLHKQVLPTQRIFLESNFAAPIGTEKSGVISRNLYGVNSQNRIQSDDHIQSELQNLRNKSTYKDISINILPKSPRINETTKFTNPARSTTPSVGQKVSEAYKLSPQKPLGNRTRSANNRTQVHGSSGLTPRGSTPRGSPLIEGRSPKRLNSSSKLKSPRSATPIIPAPPPHCEKRAQIREEKRKVIVDIVQNTVSKYERKFH